MAPIALRFKRKGTCVFLFCEPAEKFIAIKARVRFSGRFASGSLFIGCCAARSGPHLTHALPLSRLLPQLSPLLGVAQPSELRLLADDKSTELANEAMVSDFPLNDESVCFVTLGKEEAPSE